MKRQLLVMGLIALLAPDVNATPIKVDWTGTPYQDQIISGGVGDLDDGSFSNTDWMTELNYSYTSVTAFDDTDSSGTLSIDDEVVTNGGFTLLFSNYYNDADSALANNYIGDSLPIGALPVDYGGAPWRDWALTFSMVDWRGEYDGEFLQYSSGRLIVQAYDHKSNSPVNLFTINVSGRDYNSGNLEIDELVGNITTDVFYIDAPSGVQSFADYNAANSENVQFFLHQKSTNPLFGAALENAVNRLWRDGTPTIVNRYNGTMSFQVPEPTQVSEPKSITLFCLALLGLAGFSRRKA